MLIDTIRSMEAEKDAIISELAVKQSDSVTLKLDLENLIVEHKKEVEQLSEHLAQANEAKSANMRMLDELKKTHIIEIATR